VVWFLSGREECGRKTRHDDTPLTVPGEIRLLGPHEKECFSLISYTDKTLTCADCGQQFTFTGSEQQFFADRGFTEPRRCSSCRASRKAARGDSGGGYSSGGGGGYDSGYGSGGGGGYGGGGGGSRGPREMFTATCSSCGREAQVPFRPNGMKPVYCSDCFSSRR
jgi:CxxC-x17-CxxC domain-containing protein